MTKDLGNLDKCLEFKAFITNQFNEYQKMIDIGLNIPEITNEYQRLSRLMSAVNNEINLFKVSK